MWVGRWGQDGLTPEQGRVKDEVGNLRTHLTRPDPTLAATAPWSLRCPVLRCVCHREIPGALWCLALFSDVTPELWNAATGLLAQPAAAAALQPAALTQVYQVRFL